MDSARSLALIQKQPFYWTAFHIFDEPDAQWFMGRIIITNGEFWLNLREEDFAGYAGVLHPQIRLDERQLLEHFDAELGGTYFVYRPPLKANS
jgi:hypothetical protein